MTSESFHENDDSSDNREQNAFQNLEKCDGMYVGRHSRRSKPENSYSKQRKEPSRVEFRLGWVIALSSPNWISILSYILNFQAPKSDGQPAQGVASHHSHPPRPVQFESSERGFDSAWQMASAPSRTAAGKATASNPGSHLFFSGQGEGNGGDHLHLSSAEHGCGWRPTSEWGNAHQTRSSRVLGCRTKRKKRFSYFSYNIFAVSLLGCNCWRGSRWSFVSEVFSSPEGWSGERLIYCDRRACEFHSLFYMQVLERRKLSNNFKIFHTFTLPSTERFKWIPCAGFVSPCCTARWRGSAFKRRAQSSSNLLETRAISHPKLSRWWTTETLWTTDFIFALLAFILYIFLSTFTPGADKLHLNNLADLREISFHARCRSRTARRFRKIEQSRAISVTDRL